MRLFLPVKVKIHPLIVFSLRFSQAYRIINSKGVASMRVEINLSDKIDEPIVVIHANRINEEVNRILSALSNDANAPIFAYDRAEKRIVRINIEDIYIVRTEEGKTIIHGAADSYIHTKRLYEVEALLGSDFIRISKGSIVNIRKIQHFEPLSSGMMKVQMLNGAHDYVSRKFLREVKRIIIKR